MRAAIGNSAQRIYKRLYIRAHTRNKGARNIYKNTRARACARETARDVPVLAWWPGALLLPGPMCPAGFRAWRRFLLSGMRPGGSGMMRAGRPAFRSGSPALRCWRCRWFAPALQRFRRPAFARKFCGGRIGRGAGEGGGAVLSLRSRAFRARFAAARRTGAAGFVPGFCVVVLCRHTKTREKKELRKKFDFLWAVSAGPGDGKQQKSRRFSRRAL